jgi:acyl-[acyl-carrier-protein]-phospholipid O-acyltransferase/long-chain-fatty-acid--[acyl-carrier-protein] ligase
MPLPGTSCRVVNPDTLEEVGLGEEGLILISGNQVMLGYLNNEERSREVIVELEGLRWFITGDKGYLTEDGFLFVIDRY